MYIRNNWNNFAEYNSWNDKSNRMKKYLSEKNALTVTVSLFCFIMMVISLVNKQSVWEAVAFALAFSFSVELICHRAKENR